jgi:MarR family transcriptional repressor of emrRAB
VLTLQQATHACIRALGAKLAHLGLSSSEQNVLGVLADGQVRSIGELAAASGTKPSTLTSVLDRLERGGHVERDLDYSDRRSFVVLLTPAGRQAARAVHDAMADLERAALKGLTKQQLAGFMAVTYALTEASQ